jgi:hypothetical protein
MRQYIWSVERRKDCDLNESLEFVFAESKQSAGSWTTLRDAEFECETYNRQLQVAMHKPSAGICTNFQVEQRSEHEFVIVCDIG